ncbi:MAG: tyrosine-protein phosphatase [Lachnospiraceae bacterium]
MQYGKLQVEEGSLLFSRKLKNITLSVQDVLWVYRSKVDCSKIEEDTQDEPVESFQLVLFTKTKKKYIFDMSEEDTLLCMKKLKELNPGLITGYPKGAQIPLLSLSNTRDLGALRTEDGKRIIPHRLLRSGELYHVSQEDQLTLLQEYNLKTVIDLRTQAEREQKPDTQMDGVQYIHNPIFDDEALGITREKSIFDILSDFQSTQSFDMMDLYEQLVTDKYCKNHYANFFQNLTEHTEGAILWHCSAGKDRAGIATMLLLSALGVPKGAIIDDFMRTNIFLEPEMQYFVRKMQDENESPENIEKMLPLFQVRESYIQQVYRIIEQEYGTIDAYLKKEMCLTPKALEILKDSFLI